MNNNKIDVFNYLTTLYRKPSLLTTKEYYLTILKQKINIEKQ